MDSDAKQIVMKLGAEEFTRAEMLAAFNRVCDPVNWKLPIDKTVTCKTWRERVAIEAAICFYVGALPVLCFDAGNPEVRFISRGYYAICGA